MEVAWESMANTVVSPVGEEVAEGGAPLVLLALEAASAVVRVATAPDAPLSREDT